LEVYKLLIAVNGIGPKGALSILSAMSADDLRFAIISGDSKAISKAQGVGSKSAERIILELKDKIKMFDIDDLDDNNGMSGAFDSSDNKNQARNEAIEALTALGYSPTDALKTIKQIEITDDMDSGAILKAALKVISRL
jgi:Holliday junction DNA helicase RuvA